MQFFLFEYYCPMSSQVLFMSIRKLPLGLRTEVQLIGDGVGHNQRLQRNGAFNILIFDYEEADVNSLLSPNKEHGFSQAVAFSPVCAPGRMVEFPGYSLSGVLASYFFLLLTVKHHGRILFFFYRTLHCPSKTSDAPASTLKS